MTHVSIVTCLVGACSCGSRSGRMVVCVTVVQRTTEQSRQLGCAGCTTDDVEASNGGSVCSRVTLAAVPVAMVTVTSPAMTLVSMSAAACTRPLPQRSERESDAKRCRTDG